MHAQITTARTVAPQTHKLQRHPQIQADPRVQILTMCSQCRHGPDVNSGVDCCSTMGTAALCAHHGLPARIAPAHGRVVQLGSVLVKSARLAARDAVHSHAVQDPAMHLSHQGATPNPTIRMFNRAVHARKARGRRLAHGQHLVGQHAQGTSERLAAAAAAAAGANEAQQRQGQRTSHHARSHQLVAVQGAGQALVQLDGPPLGQGQHLLTGGAVQAHGPRRDQLHEALALAALAQGLACTGAATTMGMGAGCSASAGCWPSSCTGPPCGWLALRPSQFVSRQ